MKINYANYNTSQNKPSFGAWRINGKNIHKLTNEADKKHLNKIFALVVPCLDDLTNGFSTKITVLVKKGRFAGFKIVTSPKIKKIRDYLKKLNNRAEGFFTGEKPPYIQKQIYSSNTSDLLESSFLLYDVKQSVYGAKEKFASAVK